MVEHTTDTGGVLGSNPSTRTVTHKTKKGLGLFFKQGLKKFKTHGALFPSSKFLGERILKHIDMNEGICIVELGAGTGVFTKQILEKLPKSGKLIIFEIDPHLIEFLRSIINDPRAIIIKGDARDIKAYLPEVPDHIDYVVSGLPLGNFNKKDRHAIFQSIRNVLGIKGIFLQFQYLMASYLHLRKFFNIKIVGYEYRNLPPAFIYKCTNK